MTINLPDSFAVWSQLGREAYEAEEVIGHVSEQAVAAENDHYIRSAGVKRYAMATQTLGRGLSFGPTAFGSQGVNSDTDGDLMYRSRCELAEGRVRLHMRLHWGVEGTTLGGSVSASGLVVTVYDGTTAVVLDSYTTPTLTVSGTYSLDTYTTVDLASQDVRVEVTSAIASAPPDGVVRVFGILVVEDAMDVTEL